MGIYWIQDGTVFKDRQDMDAMLVELMGMLEGTDISLGGMVGELTGKGWTMPQALDIIVDEMTAPAA